MNKNSVGSAYYGNLPSSWESSTIGDLCFITKLAGYEYTEHFNYSVGGEIIAVRALNIKNGKLDITNIHTIPRDVSDSLPRSKLFAGDLVMGYVGTIGDVALIQENNRFHLAPNVAKISPGEKILPEFLLHLMLSERFQFELDILATKTSQPALSMGNLRTARIVVPPLPEQRKIAEILSTWDEAVAASERLLASLRERKKGLMQRLLTPPSAAGQAGQVRFAGFDGMWREVHLRDVFQRVTRKVGDNRVEYVLSITATIGFVDQREKFGKVIAGKNLGNYVLLQKGEFAYNKGNSNAYPQGCIYLLEEFEEGAVPNVYFSFTAKSTEVVHPHFYKFYFESGALNPQLQKYISSSARADGLFNIAFDDFFSIKIPLPPIKEQEKIAAALESCDGELRTQAKKLKALQQQKKGLMQRLLTGAVRVKV